MADKTLQSSTLATLPTGGVYAFVTISGAEYQPILIADATTPSQRLAVNSDGSVNISGARGTFTDGSNDITSADTSQQVFAANTSRKYLLVQNVSDTDMWINFGTAAVKDQPSVLLRASGGAFIAEANFVPTGTVNIICGSSGKAFTAKQA